MATRRCPRTRVLERIGSAGSIPALGEARTGRLAELPVLSLSVREGEFVLLVERVYSEHCSVGSRDDSRICKSGRELAGSTSRSTVLDQQGVR